MSTSQHISMLLASLRLGEGPDIRLGRLYSQTMSAFRQSGLRPTPSFIQRRHVLPMMAAAAFSASLGAPWLSRLLPPLSSPPRLLRRGPPGSFFLLSESGDSAHELYVGEEGERHIAFVHWKEGKLHREGDLPAMQAYWPDTGAIYATAYVLNGVYGRAAGGPTFVLYRRDGSEHLVSFDRRTCATRRCAWQATAAQRS